MHVKPPNKPNPAIPARVTIDTAGSGVTFANGYHEPLNKNKIAGVTINSSTPTI